MGNTLAYGLIAAAFLALIVLNPGEDKLRTAFMDHAQKNFFDLPREYQGIYERLRSEGISTAKSINLRYGNFLVFSTLSYDLSIGMREGKQWRDRRPLAVGALGFVFPLAIKSSSAPSAAE